MFDHFEQYWLHTTYLEEIVTDPKCPFHVLGGPARKNTPLLRDGVFRHLPVSWPVDQRFPLEPCCASVQGSSFNTQRVYSYGSWSRPLSARLLAVLWPGRPWQSSPAYQVSLKPTRLEQIQFVWSVTILAREVMIESQSRLIICSG